jgi:hypothetical protein
MTPTEKANELFNKMFSIEERFGSIGAYEAKQCALIAVDEIMNALEENGSWNYDYWNEVKQEIEKL